VATVAIAVIPVNDAPVAVNSSHNTNEDSALTVGAPGVLAGASDVDGDALSAILVSGPSHGTLTLNPNGGFSYAPASNFHGSDSFTFKANDGSADSNVATVTINVASVNDAPAAIDSTQSATEDTVLTIAAPGVLAGASDVDGDMLSAVLVSGPSHGTLSLNANGGFSYAPAAN